jgi:pimeloyl-ACP methyl ester carboxylesterase
MKGSQVLPRAGLLGGVLMGAVSVASSQAASVAASQASSPLPVKATSPDSRPGLLPCRLPGIETSVLCGVLRRPLDPAQAANPAAPHLELHYAVLPALARNRKPDPVFFFAGGPGQSATELAGSIGRLTARVGNRRDVVLIDQRGTGRSAPLRCPDTPADQPLAQAADPAQQVARLHACRSALQQLPHGDLRHYTTWVASQDVEAVRLALGAPRVNLVGASYGTRAVLDYMRQYPQAVRRAIVDGVVPPDMALPTAFSTDNQAALDAVFAACEATTPEATLEGKRCAQRYPALAAQWRRWMVSLPQTYTVTHPVTGQPQPLVVTRDLVLGLLRGPLYVPALAAGLPLALSQASQGQLSPLLGLSAAMGTGSGPRRPGALYEGMHFSVICSEDLPDNAPAAAPQAANPPGADFAGSQLQTYRQVCTGWPRGAVPAAFYRLPTANAATLVLSGGADPATPPRHGERTVAALGSLARHVVVAQAGHGVLQLDCMRDVAFRFIDADTDVAALATDTTCAQRVPRPPAFVPAWAAAGAKP